MIDTISKTDLLSALRKLLTLATGSPSRRYGVAASEILKAAHRKAGTLETSNLNALDSENRRAALFVLDAISRPFFMSDRGLAIFGADGSPLMTADEIDQIERLG